MPFEAAHDCSDLQEQRERKLSHIPMATTPLLKGCRGLCAMCLSWFIGCLGVICAVSVGFLVLPLKLKDRMEFNWTIHHRLHPVSSHIHAVAVAHDFLDCATTVSLSPQLTTVFSKRIMFLNTSADLSINVSSTQAVCDLSGLSSFNPYHAMEDLYPCWSWWQLNPHAQPIACFSSEAKHQTNYTQFLFDTLPVYSAGILKIWTSVWHPDGRNGHVKYVPCANLSGKQLVTAARSARGSLTHGGTDHNPGPNKLLRRWPAHFGSVRFFQSRNHSEALRRIIFGRAMMRACHLPSVGVLNRERHRRIRNFQAIRRSLREWGDIAEIFFESASFMEQVKQMSLRDILISPHGTQLWAIPFMPTCSGILEILPYGWWGGHYGPLAVDAGLRHMVIILSASHGVGAATAEDMEDDEEAKTHRWHAREVHMCPDPSVVAVGVRRLAWERCSCMF